MADIVIQRKTGKNLRSVMSKLLVKNYYEAIKELVSNSYDADAENVHLTYNPLENELIVEDNGEGIDEKGLEDFLRLGDSVKVEDPVSPGGRRRIGKFGIATVLLEYLADSYTLETWKDGQKIRVDEDFRQKSGEELEYKIEKIEDNSSGTRIMLRDLKFAEGEQFYLWRLKKSLIWELPDKPDFKIYLNGEELQRKNDEPVAEFQYEEELPNAGMVKTVFQYFGKKPLISGIYVYVNGRSVGDPGYFNLHKVARTLVDRVLGLVDANGLQEHISFDRSRFKEDNPAFDEVRGWVYSKLREVRKHIKIGSQRETADRVREILPESIESLRRTFPTITKSPPLLVTKGSQRYKPYQTQLRQSREQMEVSGFQLVDRKKDDSVASIDETTGEIFFNMNHPFYEIALMTDPSLIRHHLLVATAYTTAEQRFVSEKGPEAADLVRRRTELFGKYSDMVFGGDSVIDVLSRISPSEQEFVPFRLYKQKEITERGEISLRLLRKLVSVQLLVPRGELYLGKEVNDYLAKLQGYVPACEIFREYGMTLDVSRERVRQLFEQSDDLMLHYKDILPFIKNIGTEENPFFLVQEDKVDTLLGLYTKDILRRVTHMDRHLKRHPELLLLQQQLHQPEEDRFFTLYELGKTTKTSLDELLRIFTFSRFGGISIGISSEDGTEKYSLRDFLRVRNEYGGGASG